MAAEIEGRWQFGARGHWPCQWIEPSQPVAPPFVAAYRLKFRLENASQVRVHVAADERYALWLDGQHLKNRFKFACRGDFGFSRH